MTTFTLRDGTRVQFWPPRPEDQRHPYQVVRPNGAGGESGSGSTRAEAERMAQEAVEQDHG